MPHIGRTHDKRIEKAHLLGGIVARVIELRLGRQKPDDKDHVKNKRLKPAGPLLADLFCVAFRNLYRDIKYQLERMGSKKHVISLSIAVRPGIITEKLQHALLLKIGLNGLRPQRNILPCRVYPGVNPEY